MPYTRIQIATYGWLTDEIVAPSLTEANTILARLACDRYYAGEAMGGAVMQRADLPRVWDAELGDRIHPDKPIDDDACRTCQCAIRDHEDSYGRWHGCRGARSLQPAADAAGVTA